MNANINTILVWNIIVGAVKAGRSVKLDHMHVLSAAHDEIKTTQMVFKRSEIGSQGIPQITHFERTFYFDNGKEIKGTRNYI